MFLEEAAASDRAQQLFDDDEKYMGWVMNVSRLWAWQPASQQTLFDLLGSVSEGFSTRQRAILVAACASTFGDSYCSLAWGGKLAKESDAETAAGVLTGSDSRLTDAERAMARWARAVAGDPNATTQADVDDLRAAGFGDAEIFAMTVFVGLRIAFSTVNDALGAQPDPELRDFSPPEVIAAVGYGRPIADDASDQLDGRENGPHDARTS
jgi:alkylhydroperoxidase family enzyme